METITRSDISCKDCADIVNLIIKKLGQPIMTNLYYNTVKNLLERMSSVMMDKANLKVIRPRLYFQRKIFGDSVIFVCSIRY